MALAQRGPRTVIAVACGGDQIGIHADIQGHGGWRR
jgi:hypothetical protein